MVEGGTPTSDETVGPFQVKLSSAGPNVVARFDVGKSSGGSAIFASVIGSDRGEVIRFISSLHPLK
jgi:hypothetical protein